MQMSSECALGLSSNIARPLDRRSAAGDDRRHRSGPRDATTKLGRNGMSATSVGKPLRVVQGETGTVGAGAMRGVISHPELELVGVRVYSEAKAGKDAGELCGLPPTGVIATRDIDAILAL